MFPLDAWTSAMVSDVLVVISDNRTMDSAADACIGAGVAAVLLAAITGVTDWQDIHPPQARRISSGPDQSGCDWDPLS